jgi:hypothetical protein
MSKVYKGISNYSSPTSRYYFDLKRKTNSFKVELGAKQWCDLWHQHFDWKGFGDTGWLHRRRHLSALLVALSRARQELTNAGIPYQVFASVHPNDSGSDAIYVHTENPNGTPFPIVHTGEIVTTLPSLLTSRLCLTRHQVFAYGKGKERSFIIAPFEPTVGHNGQ